jgi:hypothetical protein
MKKTLHLQSCAMFENTSLRISCIIPGIIAVVVVCIFNATGGQKDTLKIAQEFQSPVSNPWAIEFSQGVFWVCNMQSSMLYALDNTMKIIDSVQTGFHSITRITFRNDELWICADSSFSDSVFSDSARYRYLFQPYGLCAACI